MLWHLCRVRLASGLQTTHTYLGNLQLVSQYLSVLGNLALALHDTGQAREILRSALTLARKLYDIPTQNWVLSNMTGILNYIYTHTHTCEGKSLCIIEGSLLPNYSLWTCFIRVIFMSIVFSWKCERHGKFINYFSQHIGMELIPKGDNYS